MELSPSSNFRLHANVRVLRPMLFADASNFEQYPEWFEQAAALSKRMNAKGYTLHSGLRSNCSMEQMIENAKRIADLFDCPAGIEGQYPAKLSNALLVSDWQEYRQLFDSGLNFALDLSHLNILKHRSDYFDSDLVKEMISSNQCMEIHVSDNDGSGDQHQTLSEKPFWFEYLDLAHADAVIFTEGNQLRKMQ